jgi:CxxC motif-containing protein
MKEILCIVCPNGCRLQVEENNGALRVTGNLCGRGPDFAQKEIVNPTRTLTTTVRTAFPGIPVLPVRTAEEIPKARIRDVMDRLKTVIVNRPLGAGEAVVEDVLGLGVPVIATSNILKEAPYG